MAVVEDTNKFLQNISPADSGVVWWTESPNAGLLEPSTPGGGIVRIASGVGLVEGWLYTNDANVDFDINAAPGNANATDIIVLQRILASQTVRLARIGGAAASKAVLTQTAATWEIPIVDVLLDGAGNLSSITDARKLALPPSGKVKIGEFVGPGSVATFTNIPPLFSNLRIVGRGRGTGVPIPATVVFTRFNSDTGLNYNWIIQKATSTPATVIDTGINDNSFDIPLEITGQTGTANYFDTFDFLIAGYATTGFKTISGHHSGFLNGAPFGDAIVSGWWQNTAIINRIDLDITTSWVTGSKIILYGEA